MDWLARIGDLVDRAGAIGEPFSIAIVPKPGVVLQEAGGVWPSGRPASIHDRFYGASLAKQLTGAAIGVLIQGSQLAPAASVASILPDAGGWATRVCVHHLLHHTAGLPGQGALETGLAGDHWTNEWVMAQLRDAAFPAPGLAYLYSNAGYVVLAQIVEAISGMTFGSFVESTILAPLGLKAIGFSGVPDRPASEQWALLGPNLPLSLGDGGMWTTATEFAKWLDLQNQDRLGIADQIARPGRLEDGTEIDYGWGIGLRGGPGQRLLVHGGHWRGASAKSIRCPDTGLAVVVLRAGGKSPTAITIADEIFGRLQPAR